MKAYQLLTMVLGLTLTVVTAQDLKIYVSDAEDFGPGSGKIIQYDIDGSNPMLFIDEELSWPQDIVFLPGTNEVIISNLNSNRITRYNAVTGDYIDDFAEVDGGPTRMKIGADGLLYVLQWSATNNNVLRYQLNGDFVDEFTTQGVPRSIGMDWDSEGNLYVSSFSQATVTRYDPLGASSGVFVDNTELSGPTNIFFDSDGNLNVFDWTAGDVEQYNSTGSHVTTFITGLGQVEGVDFLNNGNFLLGNGTTAEIKQYQSDGTFVENTVEAGEGNLEQPNAVILFDRSLLAVTDNDTLPTHLVTPSVGSAFTLTASAQQRLDSLQVFTATGKLLQQLSIDQYAWDATPYAEGVYVLVGTYQGQKISQKIIIKK